MSKADLIKRLQTERLSICYVAAYLMIPQRQARAWLVKQGASPRGTGYPVMWGFPDEKATQKQDQWNERADSAAS